MNATPWQLAALSDDELANNDIARMNLSVARGIEGLASLDVEQHCRTLDEWATRASERLARSDDHFRLARMSWRNDIRFFRLGIVCQVLEEEFGIRYHEEQSAFQEDAR